MHTEHPRDQPLGAGTIQGTRPATMNKPKSTHHSMWWYGVWLSMLDDALQIIIPCLPASRCAARAQPARRRPPPFPLRRTGICAARRNLSVESASF